MECRQEGTSLTKVMGRNIPGRRNRSYKGPSKEKKLGVLEETREDQCGWSRGGGGGWSRILPPEEVRVIEGTMVFPSP